jgi:hypothetical protein
MMNRPKGGRGKEADYNSTHIRIPEPLKLRIEELKRKFWEGEPEYYYLPNLEDAIEQAKQILAKESCPKKVAQSLLS